MKERIEIGGMHCSHCVARVRQALAALDGVTVESVTVGEAVVSFPPERNGREEVLAAIQAAGYTAG